MSVRLISRPCSPWVLIPLSFFFCLSIVNANEKSDMERLDAIQTVSDRDNEEGLRQLQDFKSKLTAETTETVRLETLKILVNLYSDAGKIKSSNSTVTELLQFAEAHHNKEAIALAQISQVFRILDGGKPDLALVKLKEVQDSIKASKDPEVNYRLHATFGSIYLVTGEFEDALSHYLEALRLSDYQPRRKIQSRLYRLSSIASLYFNMKDPEKSLATIKEAMLLSPYARAPKIFVSLLTTQAISFSILGKQNEAFEAHQKILKIAVDSNMPNEMVTALVNISDHFLVVRNYKRAEQFAKQALEKAEAIKAIDNASFAKINLGFAICGQGNLTQGMDYINEALAYLKVSKHKPDLEVIIGDISNMYERAGLYKEALATLREQQTLSTELFHSDRIIAVTSLQEKFNADQRQKQIALLAKENSLKDEEIKNKRLQLLASFLLVGGIIITSFLVLKLNRRQAKIRTQETLVQSQLVLVDVLQKSERELENKVITRTWELTQDRKSVV